MKRERRERLERIQIVGDLDPHEAEAFQLELQRLVKHTGRIRDLQIEIGRGRPDRRSS